MVSFQGVTSLFEGGFWFSGTVIDPVKGELGNIEVRYEVVTPGDRLILGDEAGGTFKTAEFNPDGSAISSSHKDLRVPSNAGCLSVILLLPIQLAGLLQF